jgi:hypothetical protein
LHGDDRRCWHALNVHFPEYVPCLARVVIHALLSGGASQTWRSAVPLSPEQRSASARAAAYSMWAGTEDWTARTAPGRAAFMSRFERQVDPSGTLTPAERARRAEAARKAYFTRLALASSRARAARRAGRRGPT